MLELPASPHARGQHRPCGVAGCPNRAGGVVRLTVAGQEQHAQVCHTHAALQAAASAPSLDLVLDDA